MYIKSARNDIYVERTNKTDSMRQCTRTRNKTTTRASCSTKCCLNCMANKETRENMQQREQQRNARHRAKCVPSPQYKSASCKDRRYINIYMNLGKHTDHTNLQNVNKTAFFLLNQGDAIKCFEHFRFTKKVRENSACGRRSMNS